MTVFVPSMTVYILNIKVIVSNVTFFHQKYTLFVLFTQNLGSHPKMVPSKKEQF